MRSPLSTSCDLDPFPTILQKVCLGALLKPTKTNIVNISEYIFIVINVTMATLTQCLRTHSCLRNTYVVIDPFVTYFESTWNGCTKTLIYTNNLSSVLQFAYKQLHSTKAALLKWHNAVKVTASTMFDLYAAFHTTDMTFSLNAYQHGQIYLAKCWPPFLRTYPIVFVWILPASYGALAFHIIYNVTKLYHPSSTHGSPPLVTDISTFLWLQHIQVVPWTC